MTEADWRECLTKLRRRVAEEPLNGEAWLELADFLDKECDNPKQTVEAYETAQQLLPDQDLRLDLGGAHVAAANHTTGITLLREHLVDRPSAHGYCLLADAYLKADHYDDAIKALETARGIDPGFEETFFLMGEAVRKSDPDQAIAYYRQAIQRDSD